MRGPIGVIIQAYILCSCRCSGESSPHPSTSCKMSRVLKKARRAFFAFGAMAAFHGKLNPISGKTIFDTCVIHILLFGSKNWILTDPLVDQLEAFHGEIGRRIFKLSKFYSAISTRLALKWPSIAARIFILKLSLLFKISSDGDSIGNRIYSSLTAKDSQSLRIIQECKSLEDKLACLGATRSS